MVISLHCNTVHCNSYPTHHNRKRSTTSKALHEITCVSFGKIPDVVQLNVRQSAFGAHFLAQLLISQLWRRRGKISSASFVQVVEIVRVGKAKLLAQILRTSLREGWKEFVSGYHHFHATRGIGRSANAQTQQRSMKKTSYGNPAIAHWHIIAYSHYIFQHKMKRKIPML